MSLRVSLGTAGWLFSSWQTSQTHLGWEGGWLAGVMGLHVAMVMYKQKGKPSPTSAFHICCHIRVFYRETEAMGYMCVFLRFMLRNGLVLEWKLGSWDPGGPTASIGIWRQDQCPAGLEGPAEQGPSCCSLCRAHSLYGVERAHLGVQCVKTRFQGGCCSPGSPFVGTSILASSPVEVRLPWDLYSHRAVKGTKKIKTN